MPIRPRTTLRLSRAILTIVVAGVVWVPAPTSAQQAPVLAREQIVIAGVGLEVLKPHQTVPRNIATSIDVQIVATGDGTGEADPSSALPADAIVEGELRGPAFGTPVTIVASPGQPLKIQPLAIEGTYVVENIRLVSGGATILEASPDTATIDVIDKVLVSQVTTTPLTAAEIQAKGIFVDQTNFDVVNFTAAFGITGQQQTISFPMILPKHPSASLPAAQPTPSLPPLTPAAVLPPPQALPQLQQVFQTNNIGISGLTLKIEDEDVARQFTIPPIPGVIVIPGNIAFLHQFFSVLLMVSNVAPGASNLVVRDVQATIVLPPGADTAPGTDDDPLRMARTGNPPVEQSATQPVVEPGPDGKLGTADDVPAIAPGENGNSEFLVEGRKEGVHTVQIQISAMLYGLPVGPVKISGFATGIVEVRNPTFSLTLSHPATVVAGEDYDLLVTVTNTSDAPANLVSLNLLPNSISGAVLKSDSSVTLNTIAAHDAATATFHLTSQVTGNVTATSFTSDDAPATFVLRTAVGALGIPLSPNSLVLPTVANALPADLRLAGIGLLGQAYALATAPAVPAGLKPISQQIVYERATDLARAGQRIGMNDTLARAVEDLTLDMLGNNFPADKSSPLALDYDGFDTLFRQSPRGETLLQAIAPILDGEVQSQGALAFQQQWVEAAASRAPFVSVVTGSGSGGAPVVLRMVGPDGSAVGQTAAGGSIDRALPFSNLLTLSSAAPLFSQLLLDAVPAAGAYTVEVNGTGQGSFDLGLTLPDGDHLRRIAFAGISITQGARATVAFTIGAASPVSLSIDDNGDGVVDRTVAASVDEPVADQGPTLVSAVQLVTGFPDASQFGQVVGLLFSEELGTGAQIDPESTANYAVDGNKVLGASLQPGGRIVLLSLQDGVGPFVARTATASNLADRLGDPMNPSTATVPIATTISSQGASFAGQVRGADGKPIAHARLQLSQVAPIPVSTGALAGLGDLAAEKEVPVTVKDLDATGHYSFDYVRLFGFANESIRLQAVDLDTGQTGEVVTHISHPGQHLDVDVIFIGTGTVIGRALAADGTTPLAGAVVKLSSLTRIGQTFGAVTDGNGAYSLAGVPAGNFTIEAAHVATNSKAVVAGSIPSAGATIVQNLTLIPLAEITITTGTVKGQVFHAIDNTPAAGVAVYTDRGGLATTDAGGSYEIDNLPAGPVTVKAIDQGRGEQGLIVATVVGNGSTIANVLIVGGTGTIQGVVISATGQRVANALIGGGIALVRTDASGAFVLQDVPIGSRQISALDESTGTTASATANLLNPGDTVNVQIVLPGQGTIAGRVFQADGVTPMVGIKVFVLGGANASTLTDANGGYRFDHLPLGAYQISAFLDDFSDGNIAASKIDFQGEVHVTNVVARGKGRVTGIVVAADGQTPLASHVGFTELTVKTGTLTPADNPQCLGDISVGDQTIELPKCQPVGIGFTSVLTRIIDTGVSGTFTFDNVLVGPFTVEAANGFSPAIIRAAGVIPHAGDTATVKLALEATSAVKGVVYRPDGVTPVGPNVVVRFSSSTLGNDPNNPFTVTTDQQGAYLFPLVNPGAFTVTATDTASGLTGRADGTVDAGATANVRIRLLGTGPVKVTVSGSNGLIPNALVTVTRGTYPNDSRQGRTGGDGSITFAGGDVLTEGPFSVTAFDQTTGITGYGSGAVPGGGAEADVQVHLDDASGTVHGRFLMPDSVTPIPNAQVQITSARGQSFATSDTAGAFSFEGVFGNFTVEAFDPVTARRGRTTGSLTINHDDVLADVAAVAQGTVKGYVRLSSDSSPAAAADVTLNVNSAFGGQLVTSTGIDGSFTFPGVSAGALSLQARDPVTGISGSANAAIINEGDLITVEIVLQVPQVGRVQGIVHQVGGAPAIGAQVILSSGAQTTVDNTGFFFVDNVPVGHVGVTANAAAGLDGGIAEGDVKFNGDVANIDVTFVGTGTVAATVSRGDGSVVPFATVSLAGQNPLRRSIAQTTETDAQGQVRFSGIPAGSISVTGVETSSGLAGSASGALAPGATLNLQITLQSAGGIRARVFRQDKTTPAAGLAVVVSGQSQRYGSTGQDGSVAFDDLALGSYQLTISDPLGTGIVIASASVANEGHVVDLGSLYLDEAPPAVEQIVPTNGASGVPVAAPIQVVFSEAINPSTVTTQTMPVTSVAGSIAGLWSMSADKTTATFTPASAYRDFTAVAVRVTTGVTDLVGKPLAGEAVSTFTTADSTPPAFVSRTPAPGARDITAASVIRVAYSEQVDPARFTGDPIALSLGGSPIAGQIAFALNNTVAVFTPASLLEPNAVYTVTIQPAFDIYGNRQTQASSYTFATTDTIAPAIAQLTAAGGTSVKIGLPVSVTATVSASDVASVDLLVNGTVVQTLTAAPFTFTVPVTAALAPSFSVAARATDLSGNVGPLQSLQLTVLADDAPTVTITSPQPGTVVNTGASVTVTVHAADDIGVAQIGFQAGGAATALDAVSVTPPAASRDATFHVVVPADAAGGSTIELKAAAIDTAGHSSATSTVSVTVADTTAPTVAISAPAADSLIDAGQTVAVTVTASDAGGVTAITLDATGAAVFSESRALAPSQTAAQATFQIPVPAAARPTDRVTLTAKASDAFGNQSAPSQISVTIRDAAAPETTIAIAGGQTTVRPGRPVTFTVSASDPGGVARVGYEATGAVSSSGTQTISPPQPSASGQFTITVPANAPIGQAMAITGTATDASNNAGRSAAASLTVVADDVPTVHLTSPPAGAHVIEGTVLTLTADASDDVGVASVVFQINGAAVATLTAPPYATQQIVPAGANGSSIVVTAVATDTAGQTATDARSLTLDVDSTSPRVTSTLPANGAVDVSIAAPVVVNFTEALDPATVTPATFQVSAGGPPIDGVRSLADGDSTVRFFPAQPLPLGTTITVALTSGITDRFGNALADAQGNPLTAPFLVTFTTGAFGITSPPAEADVLEQSRLTLEARGSASLGIAAVVFTVNGSTIAASGGPIYTAGFDVPAASTTPALTIVATAKNASGTTIATDQVTVHVTVGLTLTPSIVGVPLGGNGVLTLALSSALADDLPVSFEAIDPSVVTVPSEPVIVAAGARTLLVPLGGAAVGNTTVLAHSSHGTGAVTVSVSEPVSGQTLSPMALPGGVAIAAAPIAAEVIGAAASVASITARLTAAPVAAATSVSATSSDETIARLVNAPVVQSGQQVAPLVIATGRAGTAVLTIRAGSETRSILVVVGGSAAGQTIAALAAPTAISVAPPATISQLFTPPQASQTIQLRLLTTPATADIPVTVTSSNTSVAVVSGSVVVHAGEQVATITVTTGSAGVADLSLNVGGRVTTLTVAVGDTGAAAAAILAPPAGIAVMPAPSAGRLFTAPSGQQTLGVRLLSQPATVDTPVIATSTNPAVVDVVGATPVLTAQQVSQLTLVTGTSGTAVLTIRVGNEVRELTIVVGGAASGQGPAVIAPPIGVAVTPSPLAGVVVSPVGGVASVGLRLALVPSAQDQIITVISSDPNVASVQGPVVLHAGEQVVQIGIATAAQGTAELTVNSNGQTIRFSVIAGTPPPGSVPIIVAPIVGVQVQQQD